ncbi:hypothetical protein C9F11_37990 [Streptomyces sp. YIM 121038]|nr:hypothetical protein C9F11_37990 [Streptomyces sp. YIM 121038]
MCLFALLVGALGLAVSVTAVSLARADRRYRRRT